MTHPILEPIVVQLPIDSFSRKFIEEGRDYIEIFDQLEKERKWCRDPHQVDDDQTGVWHLEKNGYGDWLNDAEDDDFVRMVGVIHLIYDTCSALAEDLEEEN